MVPERNSPLSGEKENTRRRRNDRRPSPNVSPFVSGNPEERTAPFHRVFPVAGALRAGRGNETLAGGTGMNFSPRR